jgi:hypothetical protein
MVGGMIGKGKEGRKGGGLGATVRNWKAELYSHITTSDIGIKPTVGCAFTVALSSLATRKKR